MSDLDEKLKQIREEYFKKLQLIMEEEETSDELEHYGTPRHSGRYPWGSGENPFQHSGDFLSRVKELRKAGLSEQEQAELKELIGEE